MKTRATIEIEFETETDGDAAVARAALKQGVEALLRNIEISSPKVRRGSARAVTSNERSEE